jgi:hypothetical protein
LSLYHTGVTDAGLEQLKGLKELHELFVNQTSVTDAGIKKFRKALPTCTVYLH